VSVWSRAREALRGRAPDPPAEAPAASTPELETAAYPSTVATVSWPPGDSSYVRNWFQLGATPPGTSEAMASAAVYSCVSILAQEVSRLPVRHWAQIEGSPKTAQRGSIPTSILRRPNGYQTRSDFWLAMMSAVLLEGNAYAWAIRDGFGDVLELHPILPRAAGVLVVPTSGEVFYQIAHPIATGGASKTVPARDILHLRLFCTTHPLIGVTPLQACAWSVKQGSQIQQQSTRFFGNASRPSGLLTTPARLAPGQLKEIREQFEAGTAGPNAGRVGVVDQDLKWQPLTMSAVDAQLIEQYQLTVDDIARVYRVPLYMLGDLSKATFRNVESLQRAFVAQTLGFYLEHIEAALDLFFRLDGDSEWVEFDVEAGVQRAETRDRIEAYTKGVQGGIYTPNEARGREGLPPAEGGDELWAQSQMQPLSRLAAEPEPEPEPPPDPEPEPDPIPTAEELEAALGRLMRAAA